MNQTETCTTKFSCNGRADSAVRFLLQPEHLYNRELWAKFVDQFRLRDDGKSGGWRGEFWGKAMRGAALVYEYAKTPELYDVLTETVQDMLTVSEGDGRASTDSVEQEFTGWDLWCRKYVLLGLEYYLEICKEEKLKQRIVAFLCEQADYILLRIGEGSEIHFKDIQLLVQREFLVDSGAGGVALQTDKESEVS